MYKYISTDSTIEIFSDFSYNTESHLLNSFFKTVISLTKIDGGFIDYDKSFIYVREKDFRNNHGITYIVNGKLFSKRNRKLRKCLKSINKDNCTIEIVRGLNAYKRFGRKSIYGVLIITTK